jgi:hypothetical protein
VDSQIGDGDVLGVGAEQGGDLLIDPVDRRGAGGAAAVLAREVERVDGCRGGVGGVQRPVRTERQRPDRLELRTGGSRDHRLHRGRIPDDGHEP